MTKKQTRKSRRIAEGKTKMGQLMVPETTAKPQRKLKPHKIVASELSDETTETVFGDLLPTGGAVPKGSSGGIK